MREQNRFRYKKYILSQRYRRQIGQIENTDIRREGRRYAPISSLIMGLLSMEALPIGQQFAQELLDRTIINCSIQLHISQSQWLRFNLNRIHVLFFNAPYLSMTKSACAFQPIRGKEAKRRHFYNLTKSYYKLPDFGIKLGRNISNEVLY